MVHDLGGGMPCFDRKKPIVMKTTNSKVFFINLFLKGRVVEFHLLVISMFVVLYTY